MSFYVKVELAGKSRQMVLLLTAFIVLVLLETKIEKKTKIQTEIF